MSLTCKENQIRHNKDMIVRIPNAPNYELYHSVTCEQGQLCTVHQSDLQELAVLPKSILMDPVAYTVRPAIYVQ